MSIQKYNQGLNIQLVKTSMEKKDDLYLVDGHHWILTISEIIQRNIIHSSSLTKIFMLNLRILLF